MKKRWRTLAILAVIAAVIAAAVLWLGRPKPIAVETEVVGTGLVAETVTNTRAGTVKACQRAKLAPPAGGQIARLPVKKGDRVSQGQVLLELWNEDLRAEQELTERDAAATAARREEVCVAAEVARRESDRLVRLQRDRLVSAEQADRARGEADSREAACRAAREQIRVAQARVDAARARLERTLLRAPFDGTVAEINGEVGEFVTPSPVGIPTPPAVDVVDNSCIYITAPIDEVDAPRVQVGMPARVTLDAFKDRSFEARVRRVAPYVLDLEKQARTVEVEAELVDTSNAALLPGYSADVEVIVAERPDVLRVPTRALVEGGSVYVLDGGIARLRTVETGIGNWQYTEVRNGLANGEKVVVTVDREGLADGVECVETGENGSSR
jgi:HlyD family secretion protein